MERNTGRIANAASDTTPVVLTYNEEDNIERTLKSLSWAERVVVVDSGSSDHTEKIARAFPNVTWHVRPFESFGAQWHYAIHGTGIRTEYVLALDADMAVPGAFVEELAGSFSAHRFSGGIVRFQLCVEGVPLRNSLYPAQLRLLRRSEAVAGTVGHKHTLEVRGKVYRFRCKIVHDDRKALGQWAEAQLHYAAAEEARLQSSPMGWKAAVRRHGAMPWVVGLAAYVMAGGPFGGKAAYAYALERMTFESLLALRILRHQLGDQPVRPSVDVSL